MDATIDTKKLEKLLKAYAKVGGDLTPMMDVIAEQLVSAVSDEFDTAGHGKWPGLAASTIKKRRKRSKAILQDTGRFAGSIRAYSGPDFAEAATDVSYAVYHTSEAARRVIPLRNPFDVTDSVVEEATITLLGMLERAMANTGES